VVNMDEKPVQLIKETRQPLPSQLGKPPRYDLRIRTGGHGQRVSVHRAPDGLADG
jgi:hypothetical protein